MPDVVVSRALFRLSQKDHIFESFRRPLVIRNTSLSPTRSKLRRARLRSLTMPSLAETTVSG
jgi:hypothetical protein